MIKKALSAVNQGFAAWERTGLAPGVREKIEVSLLRTAAAAFSAWRIYRAKADARAGYPALHRTFEKETGLTLDLENPRSFQEKLQWRKIHDHNPLFSVIADKARVKDWVREQLGGEEVTVPTLFEVTSPLDLPEDIATRDVVLKVNHASKRVVFAGPGSGQTRGDILRTLVQHFYLDFGTSIYEWAYSEIDRRIIAEPILLKTNGQVPDDLRFHMLGGKLKYVQFNKPLYDAGGLLHPDYEVLLIAPDWTCLGARRTTDEKIPGLPPRPPKFERMTEIAETLSDRFDYLRVDFFMIDDDFRVSELTLYPSSGFKRFDPFSYEEELGAQWPIPGTAVLRSRESGRSTKTSGS